MPTLRTRASAGSVPAVILPPSVSGSATVGQTLTCDDGRWAGLHPVTISRQWVRGVSTNIGGATNPTYVVQAGDSGNALRCVVTASNILGAASASTPSTAAVP